MRPIGSAELARMTATAVASMNDLCDLYHFVGAADSDTGEILATYDSNPHLAISCGFVETAEITNERDMLISIDADALLRLPATQAVAVKDKIIARGKTYAVDGVTPGRNVQIIKLKEFRI